MHDGLSMAQTQSQSQALPSQKVRDFYVKVIDDGEDGDGDDDGGDDGDDDGGDDDGDDGDD
ncbi:hypothetical protein MFRU_006g03390 [Monilinia fructicola]|nr:hypothetical protein MFRU_006g03390 [Monilinia fructicola]